MKTLFHKWRDMPVMARASIMFMLSTLVLNGIGFLTTPLFTRIMSTDDYGQVATYNSWVSIIEVFATLGLTSAGILNVFYNDHRETRDKLISSLVIFCNAAAVVCFGIIAVLRYGFNVSFLPDNLILLMLIHFVFYPAFVFWITDKRYKYQYKAATAITIAGALLGQALSLVCVLWADSDYAAVRLWAAEIGTLICSVPIYIMLLARGRTLFEGGIWKSVFAASLPLLPHYLSQHIMSSSDRIMISEIISDSDAGIYNVASNVCLIAGFVWTAVNSSLVPYTHEKLNNNDFIPIKKNSANLLVCFAVLCLAVMLFAPEIIWILAPQEYYMGVYVIPPMACVAFLTALYNLYANVEFFLKMSKQIAIGTVAATLCNVGLNLVLIPRFSFIGAAYTTLISYIVLVLLQYLNYRRCRYNGIYDDRFILKLSAAVVLGGLLCSVLYSSIYIRYAVIAAGVIAAVVNRKRLMSKISFFTKKDSE